MLHPLRFIPPAQPTERSRPPKGSDWLHEVKWDGYRCQLSKLGDRVVVYSRNGKEFTGRFSGIWEAVRSLPAKSAIIDAEIVACREDGAPDFRALHSGNYSDETLCAWCFDLMELNGVDLTPLPLMARKMKLGTLLKRYDHGSLRYSEPFSDPEKLLRECGRRGLEGDCLEVQGCALSVRPVRLDQGEVCRVEAGEPRSGRAVRRRTTNVVSRRSGNRAGEVAWRGPNPHPRTPTASDLCGSTAEPSGIRERPKTQNR